MQKRSVVCEKKIKKWLTKLLMLGLLKQERVFKTFNCSLRYLLLKKRKAKKLLVVFSSYPGEGQPARYNYILAFQRLNYHRLYILDDFGPDNRGAYYLGEQMDFYIEKSVVELIETTRVALGLEKSDVVTCGSSKGGFAAIYFENKYNYRASISGAPQVLLGDYLNREIHQDIFQFIVGQPSTTKHIYLNELLYEAIRNKKSPSCLYLHVSQNEHTYVEHVQPLMKVVALKELDLGSYQNHGHVGLYFPKFAISVLKKLA